MRKKVPRRLLIEPRDSIPRQRSDSGTVFPHIISYSLKTEPLKKATRGKGCAALPPLPTQTREKKKIVFRKGYAV